MLQKELTLFDATSIVVGTIIGSGIFLLPGFIAAQLNCLGDVLLVWIIGGMITLFGALSLAELGSIYPNEGGLCSYLWHAYGPMTAFLYAWALLLMIHSGSIAALAVAFSLFLRQIVTLSSFEAKSWSVAVIAILTVINCAGIRPGKFVQNFIAATKVTALVAVIGLLAFRGSRPIRILDGHAIGTGHFPVAAFGVSLIAVLWAYEAWHVVSFAAGEMKKPQLNLPRSLCLGTSIVTLIFVAANLGYYRVLSTSEIRASNAVAATAIGDILGHGGSTAISVLVLISIAGSMNGMILTGPRVYYAMAQQGKFLQAFGKLSDRCRTPTEGLILQGAWASVLTASGSYESLFTDVIFTAWIFYGLAVAAVLVLRRTKPQLSRPFKVPVYPWLSLLFCVAALGLVLGTVIQRPRRALLGTGLIASGILLYFLASRRRRLAAASS